MIDVENERLAFEAHCEKIGLGGVLQKTDGEYEYSKMQNFWDGWLSCAESKQAEIDNLKAQINALEESRMVWREYAMKIESGEYELVTKAEAEQAKADTKRIDFLADRNQMIANVIMQKEIAERNVESLRDAIDEAMKIEEME